MGKDAEMTWKGSKGGIYWVKMTENGAILGEKMLKMGQNALKKGQLLGKDAEITRKGFKGGHLLGKNG